MKKMLFFVMILVWSAVCSADTVFPERLLDPNNTDLTKSEIKTTFTGTPAVLIEPTKNQKAIPNRAEQISPPSIPKATIKIPIKTTFGHEQAVSFLDHTTDFTVFIYVLDNQTIRIEEHIQFVSTAENSKFERTFLKSYTNPSGQVIKTQLTPLSLIPDNARNSFQLSETDDTLTMTYPRNLPKGVHRFKVRYLISGAIRTDHALTDIFLSLTGLNWQQMTERFSVVVFLPKKTTLYTKELLFGSNNQAIPGAVSARVDAVGNVIYQLTHPLPAFADVKLHMILDSASLPTTPSNVIIPKYSYILASIYLCIWVLYVLLSIVTARFKKWKKPLAAAKKLNIKFWQYELRHTPKGYVSFNTAICSFIRFNIEYIVGLSLLITITYIMANEYNIHVDLLLSTVWVLSVVIALPMIDRWGTQSELTHLKNQLKHALLDTPQGLNLAQRDIATYYIIASHLGFGDEWAKRLINNNPAYQDLFTKKGENK